MNTEVHLLWTSEWGRPTNTEHHLRQLQAIHPELQASEIVRAKSNALALQALLESNSSDNSLTLAPFYNVHGKGVKDTMKIIAENYTRLRLLHTSRLSVDYILAYRKWRKLQDMRYVVTHTQAILQTKSRWQNHWLPSILEKIWDENTAAGLDFLHSDDPRVERTIAISTPWQWKKSDEEILTRVDNFGPENNHTYFGLFWLRWSDVSTIITPREDENPEDIQLGVIELDDVPWSLANALESISAKGRNIHSIKSFPQNSGKVLFVIAYNEWIREEASHIIISWPALITEMYDIKNDVIPNKYRLSIPNHRWSLGKALRSIAHLINIRSIESIWTSRTNCDFEIEVVNWTDEILASLNDVLSKLDFNTPLIKDRNTDYKLHTLNN